MKKDCPRCNKPMEFYQEDDEVIDFVCRDCEIMVRVNKSRGIDL